jgi:hypothetical protein
LISTLYTKNVAGRLLIGGEYFDGGINASYKILFQGVNMMTRNRKMKEMMIG